MPVISFKAAYPLASGFQEIAFASHIGVRKEQLSCAECSNYADVQLCGGEWMKDDGMRADRTQSAPYIPRSLVDGAREAKLIGREAFLRQW